MALIEVSGLTFAYGQNRILDGIDLTIDAGDRIAILGANGDGKSTLAQWIAGWLPSHCHAQIAGEVRYRGRVWADWPLVERCAAVQLVGQIPSQHLSGRAFTVRDEIAFGPENLNLPVGEIRARVEEALEACRLGDLAGRNPFSLSGGEQQRLVLAAALALRPQIIVLDEPFTNLDPESRDHTIAVLQGLPADVGLVMFETNATLALRVARYFALLDAGRLVLRGGARAVLLHPSAEERMGLPAAAAAFRDLQRDAGLPLAGLPLAGLPLTIEEARSLIERGRLPC